MPTYPIRVPRKNHHGRDSQKILKSQEFNALAERLERYVNDEFMKNGGSTQVFIYASIASELGLAVGCVHDVLSGVDAGHNGITVTKGC
jgi:hypothetical protein